MKLRLDKLRPPRARHTLAVGAVLVCSLATALVLNLDPARSSAEALAQPQRTLSLLADASARSGAGLHASLADRGLTPRTARLSQPQPQPVDPETVRELRTDPEASEPDPAPQPAEPGVDGLVTELDSAPKPKTDPELDEVFWEVPEDMSLDRVASAWGFKISALRKLNPDTIPEAKKKRGASGEVYLHQPELAAGTKLRVFKKDPERPTRSIGAPNRGKLRSGIPMPEGPYWRLRPRRPRTFATHKTISSLLAALRAFGQAYPEGPRVRLGEFSKYRGGRIYPHRSHRTGRDVDIGYLKLNDDPERTTFMRTTRKNFDAERNWVLIYAILKTGNVQSIYMSSRIQKQLYKEAKKHIPEAELHQYFQYPWHDDSAKAIIRHQSGHKNHFHVRFRCEDWNRRCRARSRQ